MSSKYILDMDVNVIFIEREVHKSSLWLDKGAVILEHI